MEEWSWNYYCCYDALLFAAVISYFGLFTGLALAGKTATTDWLLALVAGLFVYVALVDVVSLVFQ